MTASKKAGGVTVKRPPKEWLWFWKIEFGGKRGCTNPGANSVTAWGKTKAEAYSRWRAAWDAKYGKDY